MFSFAKFLRISLPVATGASAIVATTLLVASMHDKDKVKKNENDEILKDLEKPTEEFKEEKIINEEPEEKEEVDSEKEKGAQGSQEEKSEKTKKEEEYDSNIGKELVERVMRGEEITLGEETLRGKGDTSESKPDDVSQLTEEKSPPQEGLPSEESPSITSGDFETSSESPQPPEEKIEGQNTENSEQLESTEPNPISKETEGEDDPKEQASEQEEELDVFKSDGEQVENGDVSTDEEPSQQESSLQGDNEVQGEEVGEPDGDTRKESAEGQEGEAQTDSSGKGDDGIEDGTAEEDLPNLDLLNSLEDKLNNEISSLGARLRNFGIRV